MGCCRLGAMLTGQTRGVIQDSALRRLYDHGPREAFHAARDCMCGRVLEVGCGTGVLFDEYPDSCEIFAIEPDADFLPLARRSAGRRSAHSRGGTRVVSADVQALPFSRVSFDAVVLHLVMCCVDDPQAGLNQVLEVLKPGGLLYVYEHVLARSSVYRGFQHVTAPLWTWMAEGCRWNRRTDEMLRALPVDWEVDERISLKKGMLPGLPVARMLGRKRSCRFQ